MDRLPTGDPFFGADFVKGDAAYTATKEPYDKAGAYAIQGRAPSGSTGWKGTTTPSWACPSAGRPVC